MALLRGVLFASASVALMLVGSWTPGFLVPGRLSNPTQPRIGAPLRKELLPVDVPEKVVPNEPSRVERFLTSATQFTVVAAAAALAALPSRRHRTGQSRSFRCMSAGAAAAFAAHWKTFVRTDAALMLRLSTLNFCKIYMAMLVLRITIMWFPNINPYRQPFYSMIQLTDPYLNLFRGWMPPIFGIDLSVILAFVVIQAAIDNLTISPF
mmetsp:Transcript_101149/g.241104  ORF Transcript_101149/g.241104 Transcript_101149/m.241104 type:complete len:209 (+) Transcript_101149:39-665(+)|eukprot:CAMPEP_0181477604 /NCGR_PEP_ID=MMETSP1110-20121109/42301_1 /TAXON_ID=174948 /ORGANISM="Symbiodinium sp., Strain CCMP421" /LENGTH=208 /DNA_ID=CAMNT_0023602909 /DNA_START=39 /DNA_END=665 /DNA_ORIENTATION=-